MSTKIPKLKSDYVRDLTSSPETRQAKLRMEAASASGPGATT